MTETILVTGAFGLVGSATGRKLFERRAPYRGRPGVYADPWSVIAEKWSDPSASSRSHPSGEVDTL